jgi:hypothetical protein
MTVLFLLFVVGIGVMLVSVFRQFFDGQPLQPSWQEVLVRRADEQHAAIMRGDYRLGIYGKYPPADLS